MNPPLEPWNDPTLEARVVARVLGEASAFERAEIDRLLAESPELAAFARRIRAVHGLLGEATRGGTADLWKMDPERRGKLLLALGAPAPASKATAAPAPKKRRFMGRLLALAACIAFGLIALSGTNFSGAGGCRRTDIASMTPRVASSRDEEMKPLDTGMLVDLPADGTKDRNGELTENQEELQGKAFALRAADKTFDKQPGNRSLAALDSAPGPFGSFEESQPTARPSRPAAPAPPPTETLVVDSKFKADLSAGTDQQKQVAIETKHVEVLQRNIEDLRDDSFLAKENLKLQGGFADGGASGQTMALASGSVDMEGYSGAGGPILGSAGVRAGNAPVTRRQIDGILKEQEARLDELSKREEVAKLEIVRESASAPESPNQSVEVALAGKTADGSFFPVTPATPVDDVDQLDPFGNSVRYPTEYEPPALPGPISGLPREDVSKLDPADVPVLGDVPMVGALFANRWDATNAPAAEQSEAAATAVGKKMADPPDDPFAGEEKGKGESPVAFRKPAPAPAPPPPSLENQSTETAPVSTFSLHVSDASFQLGAQTLLGGGAFPAPESVRAEDYINAMDYGDAMPARGEAVSAVIQQSAQPFVAGRNLVRVGVRTAADGRAQGQPLSLVLLIDQSGSMERPDRAAAMGRALGELGGLLGKDDTLTVIGFAREPRLLADRWSGERAGELPALIRESPPQGGTNLDAAFDVAAEAALRQAKPGAQNRIVLFTDGAANLGQIEPEKLAARVDGLRRQRIAFDACGVGTGELDDRLLEAMARRGDGRYLLLDAAGESPLAKQLAGAFRPAARDVKVQVRFNPERVEAYQLFGFENHLLNEEDFRDDRVDAAELAAAEQGNALYQVKLRTDGTGDIGEVAVRFRDTRTDRMIERHWIIPFDPATPALAQADPSMQLAAAAGLLAESLRGSPIGQSVDPAALAPVEASLRAAFPGDPRVATLLAMWERVRQTRP